MMSSRWSLLTRLWLLVALSACGQRVTPTPDFTVPLTGGIGIVRRVTDRIEHGDSPSHLETVAESQEFVAGDVLRVADGGEGLLDFGEYLQLRLFNDTETRVIKAEHGTDIPLLARIRLEHGGFTGNLTNEGSEVVFETPNGAEITILGTQFFLVYDSENQVLGAGNFTGTVSLSVSGQVVPVSSGYYVVVRQDQPPEPERPIRISMTDFEQSSRTLVSPVVAFQALIEPPISSTSADTPTPTRTPSPTLPASPVYTSTPACPPMLLVVQDANCREGPGTGWEAITGFKSGEELRPGGVSPFQPLWWYVTIPSSGSSCWISDVTVNVIGDASCLPVIAPPPTYTPRPPTPTINPVPIIDSVNLRYVKNVDNILTIYQDIYFRDGDGDVNYVTYEIVYITPGYTAEVRNGPVEVAPEQQKSGGMFTGQWNCSNAVYDVTLLVTIYDLAGHQSNSLTYTMNCY